MACYEGAEIVALTVPPDGLELPEPGVVGPLEVEAGLVDDVVTRSHGQLAAAFLATNTG